MNCINCGNPLSPSDTKCDFCGTPVAAQTQSAPNPFGAPAGGQSAPDPFGAPAGGQSAPDPFGAPAGGQSAPDPFGAPAGGQSAPDPFGAPAGGQSAPDPFGAPAGGQSAPDPFGAPACGQSAPDPFGAPAGGQSAPDPFSSPAGGGSMDDLFHYSPAQQDSSTDLFGMSNSSIGSADFGQTPVKSSPVIDKKMLMYIGIGAGIVVLICALIALFAGMSKGNDESFPPDKPSPVEPVPDDGEDPETPIGDPEDVSPIYDNVIRDIISSGTSYTDYGIYVKNLNNDYEYSYNGDRVFLASAMCQVVILDTLSTVMRQNDRSPDSTSMYFDYIPNGKEAPSSVNEGGQYLSVRKCVEDVAIYGDNNKSNQIIDCIASISGTQDGFYVINNNLRNNGFYNTEINRKTYVNQALIDTTKTPNQTTPEEISNIFENLINNSVFGNKTYMMNIFRSVSNKGDLIGLKKHIPPYYNSCNVNAVNSEVTNNVALITDGETEIVVALFANTDASMTSVEKDQHRDAVQKSLIEYILDTQFD